MEQVDKIIIDTLNSLGCDLEDEVCSLSQFGLAEVVTGTVYCLKAINADGCSSLSHKLPQNMAQRFRAAAAIAQEVKNIGFNGDLGYQSLLYPNEVDIRRLFSFLLEKLPKDSAEIHQEALSSTGLLLATARAKLQNQLSRPWVPPHCKSAILKRKRLEQHSDSSKVFYGHQTELFPLGECRHLKHCIAYPLIKLGGKVDVGTCAHNIITDKRILINSLLAAHALQLQTAQMLPSLLDSSSKKVSSMLLTSTPVSDRNSLEPLVPLQEPHLLSVATPSSDSMITPLSPLSPQTYLAEVQQQLEETSIAGSVNAEERMKELKVNVAKLESERDQTMLSINAEKEQSKKLMEDLSVAEQELQQVDADLSSIKRTMQLLPSSGDNIARLNTIIDSSDAKMAKLKDQFTTHCVPLDEKIETLKKHLNKQQSYQEQLTEEIKSLRQKRVSYSQEVPKMEAQVEVLTEKLQNRGEAIGRSFYTKSILEITNKVHQQRRVTEALLDDIRKVQKEINSLGGKIDRSFTLIEDVSYRASWSNSRSASLYRCVISIHEGCSSVVQVIRETGALKRQCAELKEQVMLEERRDTAKALTKLQDDLAAIKQENAALKAKLAQ